MSGESSSPDAAGGEHGRAPQDADLHAPEAADRRDFLGLAATGAMAGGLVAGYGTLAVYAGQFLYPTSKNTAWMYVARADELLPGGAMEFLSPTGLKVVITRTADSQVPRVEDYLALSSVCPHLGCRVHWEPQNDRFFYPCHNGAFDASGQPTEGPPLQGNTPLPEYPLMIDEKNGLLYIEMPFERVVEESSGTEHA